MLKNILKLDGAQKLSKNEQKSISGGLPVWSGYCKCADGSLVYASGNGSLVCYYACIGA